MTFILTQYLTHFAHQINYLYETTGAKGLTYAQFLKQHTSTVLSTGWPPGRRRPSFLYLLTTTPQFITEFTYLQATYPEDNTTPNLLLAVVAQVVATDEQSRQFPVVLEVDFACVVTSLQPVYQLDSIPRHVASNITWAMTSCGMQMVIMFVRMFGCYLSSK